MSNKKITMGIGLLCATPSAATLTITGGASGAFSYKLVAIAADGTHSAASAAVSTSSGPTTLDSSHHIVVDPTGLTNVNATSYDVYRTAGGSTQGKIGNILNDGASTLNDTGLVADGTTAPATNTTGTGSALDIRAYDKFTAFVSGTFTATVLVEVTPDGTNWFTAAGASAVATGTAYTVPPAMKVRVRMSAFTSGAPVVTLYGMLNQ